MFAPLSRRGALALPAACLAARPAVAQTRPIVVASFSILGDMVAQVGGDRIALRVLAGPDADAHAFQPRPSDAEAIRGAALVVRNGLGFEPWLDRLLRSTRFAGPVVTAADQVAPLPIPGRGGDVPDPHAWQDIGRAQDYVRAIAAGLTGLDAAAAPTMRDAAARYLDRLAAHDAWVRGEVARVPEARRVLVTSHGAFGYLAAAYGVRVLAPQGPGSHAQPSAQQVAALIRQIRAERITAVFLDGPGSQALMDRLARDAGVAVRGRLYADTLSPPDGPAATYEAMVRHNLGLMIPAMLA